MGARSLREQKAVAEDETIVIGKLVINLTVWWFVVLVPEDLRLDLSGHLWQPYKTE